MTAVIGIVGWSGSGKTTLLEGVVRHLAATGQRVSTIKHAHRRFDMDRPGKDSYRHRVAGAGQVLVLSPDRSALLTEHRGQPEPSLADALAMLAPTDIVLIEGYRGAAIDKIEVWRAAHGGDPLYGSDARVVAVASDAAPGALPAPLGATTLLPLNAPEVVARFILAHFKLKRSQTEAPGP